MSLGASADGSLAHHYDYSFDSNSTLMSRGDWLPGGLGAYVENFCYDALNRLRYAAVGSQGSTNCALARPGNTARTFNYDDLGNIIYKSDVGTYSYTSAAHPHAVTAIAGTVMGNTNPHYTYDANGNLTCEYVGAICGSDTSIRETAAWTSYNMARVITQGTTSVTLSYDSERARSTQHVVDGSTITDTTYLNDPMSGAMSEKVVSAGTTTWHDYLMADGRMVAEHFKTGASESWSHFILDHLGSVAIITGIGGIVAERQSYDVWGRRRNADGTDDTTCSITSQSTRGFTGQEEIPAVCLINFNARIYDPTLGRFMSADSVTQDLYNLQVLNRYSYCGNNPLSFTDPSGHLFGIDDILLAAIVLTVAGPVLHIPILGDLGTILANLACGPLCAGASAAVQAGLSGGNIGDIIAAFALTTGESGLMLAAGHMQVTSWVPKALAAGMIGGMVSAGQTGNFAPGFLAAGISMAAGSQVSQIAQGDKLVGTLISAVIGGVSSELGGGKFLNGAVTGAFAYVASGPENTAYRESSEADADVDPATLVTGEPETLDEIDQATLGSISIAQAQQGAHGTKEPGGFTYDLAGDNPVNFGTEGDVPRGSVENGAGGPWALAGWHGHGPIGSSPYSRSNSVNYFPSSGDRLKTYSGETQQMRDAGKLCGTCELREYLITPDGGIRKFDYPVSHPTSFTPIAPTGTYKWH